MVSWTDENDFQWKCGYPFENCDREFQIRRHGSLEKFGGPVDEEHGDGGVDRMPAWSVIIIIETD